MPIDSITNEKVNTAHNVDGIIVSTLLEDGKKPQVVIHDNNNTPFVKTSSRKRKTSMFDVRERKQNKKDMGSSDIDSRKWPKCLCWLPKKLRFCNFDRVKLSTYCGNHISNSESVIKGEDKRIPCPYDGAHTIKKGKLKTHVLICNAVRFDVYIMKYYNDA